MGRVLLRIWVRVRAWYSFGYSFECAFLVLVNGLLILVTAPWKEIGFAGLGYPQAELARGTPLELATPGSVRP